jgi:4-hydroxybenzoate polyprenyltransferase
MGGFALNDFFDQDTDAINRPYRPIPSKSLIAQHVLVIGIILSSAALLIGLVVAENYIDRIIYVATVAGVLVYNIVVRYVGIGKTIYTGVLTALPYTMVICKGHFERRYWLFIFAIIIFVTGRELLMDACDEAGDRMAERDTLAIKFGGQNVLTWGAVFQIVGAIMLLPLAITSSTPVTELLVFSAIAAAVICVVLQVRRVAPRACIYACWVPMMLGLAALCVR